MSAQPAAQQPDFSSDKAAAALLRATTLEEIDSMRTEVASMAKQLQLAAKALAARVADCDRREVELERRRLDIARRHEEQLLDIEAKSRRIITDMQARVEIEEARNKEKERTVQDTLGRLAAVQRDYDLLQAAVLRVQNRDVEHHEQLVVTTRKQEELQKVLEATLVENAKLRVANSELQQQATKAKSATAHYRGECQRAIERYNEVVNAMRVDHAARLSDERAALDLVARKQRLEALQSTSVRGPGAGDGRPWAHQMALTEIGAGAASSAAAAMRQELRQSLAGLTKSLAREAKHEERARQHKRSKASTADANRRAALVRDDERRAAKAARSDAGSQPPKSTSLATHHHQKNAWCRPKVAEPMSCEISSASTNSEASDEQSRNRTGERVEHIYEVSADGSSLSDIDGGSYEAGDYSGPQSQEGAGSMTSLAHRAGTTATRYSSNVAETAVDDLVDEYVEDYVDEGTVVDASTEALAGTRTASS